MDYQLKAQPCEGGPGRTAVAVLSVLATFESMYSIAAVTLAQLHLLARKGYDVVFVTADDFSDYQLLPPGVQVRTFPRYTESTPKRISDHKFQTYIEETGDLLSLALEDRTHCLTHDVLFLHDFVSVNWAIRCVASRLPQLKWFHWMHSAPSPRPRNIDTPLTACYSGMANSTYISVDRTDVPRFRDMFRVPESHVRTVHNWVDPLSKPGTHPISKELYDSMSLFEADYICVYAARLVPAKQPERIIKLIGDLNRDHGIAKLIICSSYANSSEEQEYTDSLYKLANERGLDESSFVITSRFESAFARESGLDLSIGVPHAVVWDLLSLSDLFILPSVSEACSLSMLEAGLSKCLVVLNHDLLVTTEFGGQELDPEERTRCLAFSFGSVTRPIAAYHPSEDAWIADRAAKIAEHQRRNTALAFFKYVRKEHSPDWIFRNQLQPLLESVSHDGVVSA